MKIEELKQGQTVWVKGYVDSSVFGGCGGFINFYNQDGNHCGHISRNNVREMKEEDVQIDQPKPVLKKEHAEWLEELKNEFPDNLPNQLYHITRQGWGYGLVFESNTGQKIKISNLDNGKLKKDLVNALIYGYTIEKEKLYQIIDKRLNATFSCLGYDIEGRAWFWGNKKFFKKNKGDRLAHTRQQLIDAGFEEVFENPNYEAEEVKNDL